MKKKLKKILALMLIMSSILNVPASAAPEKNYQPAADTYTEGIYHFKSGSGNKLNFRLLTLDKPITIMIIEDNNLKYYTQLNKQFQQIQVILSDPLSLHTTVLVGEGELSFTFE